MASYTGLSFIVGSARPPQSISSIRSILSNPMVIILFILVYTLFIPHTTMTTMAHRNSHGTNDKIQYNHTSVRHTAISSPSTTDNITSSHHTVQFSGKIDCKTYKDICAKETLFRVIYMPEYTIDNSNKNNRIVTTLKFSLYTDTTIKADYSRIHFYGANMTPLLRLNTHTTEPTLYYSGLIQFASSDDLNTQHLFPFSVEIYSPPSLYSLDNFDIHSNNTNSDNIHNIYSDNLSADTLIATFPFTFISSESMLSDGQITAHYPTPSHHIESDSPILSSPLYQFDIMFDNFRMQTSRIDVYFSDHTTWNISHDNTCTANCHSIKYTLDDGIITFDLSQLHLSKWSSLHITCGPNLTFSNPHRDIIAQLNIDDTFMNVRFHVESPTSLSSSLHFKNTQHRVDAFPIVFEPIINPDSIYQSECSVTSSGLLCTHIINHNGEQIMTDPQFSLSFQGLLIDGQVPPIAEPIAYISYQIYDTIANPTTINTKQGILIGGSTYAAPLSLTSLSTSRLSLSLAPFRLSHNLHQLPSIYRIHIYTIVEWPIDPKTMHSISSLFAYNRNMSYSASGISSSSSKLYKMSLWNSWCQSTPQDTKELAQSVSLSVKPAESVNNTTQLDTPTTTLVDSHGDPTWFDITIRLSSINISLDTLYITFPLHIHIPSLTSITQCTIIDEYNIQYQQFTQQQLTQHVTPSIIQLDDNNTTIQSLSLLLPSISNNGDNIIISCLNVGLSITEYNIMGNTLDIDYVSIGVYNTRDDDKTIYKSLSSFIYLSQWDYTPHPGLLKYQIVIILVIICVLTVLIVQSTIILCQRCSQIRRDKLKHDVLNHAINTFDSHLLSSPNDHDGDGSHSPYNQGLIDVQLDIDTMSLDSTDMTSYIPPLPALAINSSGHDSRHSNSNITPVPSLLGLSRHSGSNRHSHTYADLPTSSYHSSSNLSVHSLMDSLSQVVDEDIVAKLTSFTLPQTASQPHTPLMYALPEPALFHSASGDDSARHHHVRHMSQDGPLSAVTVSPSPQFIAQVPIDTDLDNILEQISDHIPISQSGGSRTPTPSTSRLSRHSSHTSHSYRSSVHNEISDHEDFQTTLSHTSSDHRPPGHVATIPRNLSLLPCQTPPEETSMVYPCSPDSGCAQPDLLTLVRNNSQSTGQPSLSRSSSHASSLSTGSKGASDRDSRSSAKALGIIPSISSDKRTLDVLAGSPCPESARDEAKRFNSSSRDSGTKILQRENSIPTGLVLPGGTVLASTEHVKHVANPRTPNPRAEKRRKKLDNMSFSLKPQGPVAQEAMKPSEYVLREDRQRRMAEAQATGIADGSIVLDTALNDQFYNDNSNHNSQLSPNQQGLTLHPPRPQYWTENTKSLLDSPHLNAMAHNYGVDHDNVSISFSDIDSMDFD